MEICRLVKSILGNIEKIKQIISYEFKNIRELDQSILAKAFRGELVPPDPNDEPASVLLERIRAEREAEVAKTPTRRRVKRKVKK